LEKDNYKLYWDHTLLVDNTVPLNWPDVTLIDSTNKKVAFIDIARPLTHSLQDTVTEKQCKYQDLAFEINNSGN